MSHCVFIHRSDSIYDDNPALHYQFPRQYLSRAKGSIGDWIVYLEPLKVTRSRGYFAVAQVSRIVPDPKAADMYLALIEPGTYLEFARYVPFNRGSGPIESGLLNPHGKLSGRAQAAVRPLSAHDFKQILDVGLAETDSVLPRLSVDDRGQGFAEPQVPFVFEQSRDRVAHLGSRLLRDRVFRKVVLQAYGERCAITGLKLINGGGRAEVNAAHIRPVAAGGPDSLTNGIALSGTAHWMFDRGLISLGDDLKILVSRQVNDADGVRNFVNASGYAFAPDLARDRPHPRFLQWHRETCFKA